MVDFMKIEKIEKYLEEVSEGTDFSFTVEEEENKELILYMQGDNPEGEDWCETLTIQNPKTKRELLENLCEEIDDCYNTFDIEENVYLMLEAKRNGFRVYLMLFHLYTMKNTKRTHYMNLDRR